ncbi:MAG TPA: DUF177 domain-containing protein [Phenylobacterium sp.]|uniref:YceD family protein n=1 Tax=Phenylobacterium sp. TaxID=1871053 RepID=UPI002CA80201|nr:DUF177 domain-containing protein [Phenylobacterium sp.]HXA39746.1 DUF177 domain-containing protein [Phenylobacterium sp.]
MTHPWDQAVRLHELGRGTLSLRLEPDASARTKIARELGLVSLPSLTARLTLKPWMDGVEITGRFEAVVEQTSAVSLENFEQPLAGEIEVRAVPTGSPNAQAPEGGEIDYDPEAPDPPDILESDTVDLAGYVVEHLALEIDPFARKPWEEFEFQPPSEPESPFAVLKKLKGQEP